MTTLCFVLNLIYDYPHNIRLLDIARSSKEREEILAVHAKSGKFRGLATGGEVLFCCVLARSFMRFHSVMEKSGEYVRILCYAMFMSICNYVVYMEPGKVSPDEIKVFREALKMKRDKDSSLKSNRRVHRSAAVM
jgi:hypothetical protein